MDKNFYLYYAKIGFEFEFYSNFSIEDTKEKLSRLFNRKLMIFEESHSDFSPSYDVWKLEKDYSGGAKLIELVTGALPYNEARLVLIKALKWIRENGSTNDRSSVHINISFNEDYVPDNFMTKMDTLKFILDFNEDLVYKYFPGRKNIVYAKSIKWIIPLDKFYIEDLKEIDPKNFIVPSTKYYGVNFSKLISNYLEFRYIGGEGYEKKEKEILILIDEFIKTLYFSITEKKYTNQHKKELLDILKNHKKLIDSYSSYKSLKENFPEIDILIDLSTDKTRVEFFYQNIRDRIFKLLSESGITKGVINYDSDRGRIQIKEMILPYCYYMEGIDIVQCKIQGNLVRCDIFESEIKNSDTSECNYFKGSIVLNSKVKDSYVNKTVVIKDSYIYGKNGVTSGEVFGGIFREGSITNLAKIHKDVEVVEFKKIK